MIESIKKFLRNLLGEIGYGTLIKLYYSGRWNIHKLRLGLKSTKSIFYFLIDPQIKISILQRLHLLKQFQIIQKNVWCPHWSYEILAYVSHILGIEKDQEGVFVEAGCCKGGSSAKFSLAAKLVGKKLIIFDSFQGLPENDENQGRTIFGEKISAFNAGAYQGTLEEVKSNITRFGAIESCEFVKGWFDDTLPSFTHPLLGAYIDVDLASSTKTCLKYLYPRLVPGGAVISQDGHLPPVLDLLNNDEFWKSELGSAKPQIHGFGKSTILSIFKFSETTSYSE